MKRRQQRDPLKPCSHGPLSFADFLSAISDHRFSIPLKDVPLRTLFAEGAQAFHRPSLCFELRLFLGISSRDSFVQATNSTSRVRCTGVAERALTRA